MHDAAMTYTLPAVKITTEQAEQLRALAAKNQRSVSGEVRFLIAKYLEETANG